MRNRSVSSRLSGLVLAIGIVGLAGGCSMLDDLTASAPEAPTVRQERMAALARQFLLLSRADQSVLVAALATDNPVSTAMVTTNGSNNYKIWSQMADLGWLVETIALDHAPISIHSFALTPLGVREIPHMLETAFAIRAGGSAESLLAGEGDFSRARCGDLFQRGTRTFRGHPREFIYVVQFAWGYYYGHGRMAGLTLNQLGTSRTIMPTLYQHCLANPATPLRIALDQTVPQPDGRPEQMIADDTMTAACGDWFAPRGDGIAFKGENHNLRMIYEYVRGFYSGWLQYRDAPQPVGDSEGDFVSAFIDLCVRSPADSLLDVLIGMTFGPTASAALPGRSGLR